MVLRLINLFLKNKGQKIKDNSDTLLIKKRQLLHQGIPDLPTVKKLAGERFDILLEIINKFDPIKGEKLSENPSKYALFCKTLIYRLPKQKNIEDVTSLIMTEFSLWFNHGYHSFSNKENLAKDVYDFKAKYLETNPFVQDNSNMV